MWDNRPGYSFILETSILSNRERISKAMHSIKNSGTGQWLPLYLIFIATAIYGRPPIPIDETRYLSVAWEMWQSGNFLVPHINGEPYSHKPPLLFWLIHLSWHIFGVTEWSARIIGPLFGLATLLQTVLLAKCLWPGDKSSRITAPFILTGSIIWCLYSSLTMFDTLLTFCTLTGLYSIFKAKEDGTVLPWMGLSVSLALGILAKGPVIILFLIPPMLFAPWWVQEKDFSYLRWCCRATLFTFFGIALAGCWFFPAALSGGEQYSESILFGQTAGRMLNSFAHNRPFYWYLCLLPLLLFPWFFWLPAWKQWKVQSQDRSIRFCLTTTLPAFLLLSLFSGKQIHYLLPMLPVFSLLVARTTSCTMNQQLTYRPLRPMLILLVFLVVAIFILPKLQLEGGDRDMLKYLPGSLVIAPLVCTLLLLFFRTHSVIGHIKLQALCVVVLASLLHLLSASPLHVLYDQYSIGLRLQEIEAQGNRVAIYPDDLADQFQFAGRLTKPLVPLQSIAEMRTWAESNPNQYCLLFTDTGAKSVTREYSMEVIYKDGWLTLAPTDELFLGLNNTLAQQP